MRSHTRTPSPVTVTVTDDTNREAFRNMSVFGGRLPASVFSPVFTGIIHGIHQGFPLIGHEEIVVLDSDEANQLRLQYLTNSESFDAGKITAEQFRNAVLPLWDKLVRENPVS